MNNKLFLDTNVVIDFFCDRPPFSKDAVELFKLRDIGVVDFSLSSLTLATLAYHIKKLGQDPSLILTKLLVWVHVTELDKALFEQTISSKFKDFEDGLQYFSALRVRGIDAIITRNKKDFTYSKIPVLTPAEFLISFDENK